jgi:hypothetical protein
MKILNLHVLESSASPKLELDESKAAAFRAVFSLLQWSLPFFFYKKREHKTMLYSSCKTVCFTNFPHNNKCYHDMHFVWQHLSVLHIGTLQVYTNVPSFTQALHSFSFSHDETNLFTA